VRIDTQEFNILCMLLGKLSASSIIMKTGPRGSDGASLIFSAQFDLAVDDIVPP